MPAVLAKEIVPVIRDDNAPRGGGKTLHPQSRPRAHEKSGG